MFAISSSWNTFAQRGNSPRTSPISSNKSAGGPSNPPQVVLRRSLSLGLVGLSAGFAFPAEGQDFVSQGMVSSSSRVESPGSKFTEDFILPSGVVELGGELVFVTAGPALRGRDLDFTDLALGRLRLRRRIADWAEVFVNLGGLVKQPKYTDEPVFQGGLLGFRFPFAKKFAAEVIGGGGPLLESAGHYWQSEQAIVAKPAIDRHTRFQLRAGGAFTRLIFDDRTRPPLWMEQLVLGVELDLGDRKGGGWIGFDYRVPLASGPKGDPSPHGRPFDPAVELGLQVGGILSARSDWDLFVAYSVVDRGDLSELRTTLPILDGGFDQKQILFGVQHRFERRRHGSYEE